MSQWNDYTYVLNKIKINGNYLKNASSILQNNYNIVMTVVKNDNSSFCALQYASIELQNNKEIVLEAVKQRGRSLKYASNELKNNKEIVMAAIKNNCHSLKFASTELRYDIELIAILVNYLKKNRLDYNYYYTDSIKMYLQKYKTTNKISSVFKIYLFEEKIKIYHNDFDLSINYK
jgi:hypothetical protein